MHFFDLMFVNGPYPGKSWENHFNVCTNLAVVNDVLL